MSQANENIVDSHRKMLMLSKQLSDFQLTNLKQWPFLFFNGVDSVEVIYNFIENEEFCAGTIEFDIKTKDFSLSKEEVDKGCVFLKEATRLLFWSDTKILIRVNGEECQEK